MSELPRTDDLPRTAEGYDPLRVEEAFASFADRVRELETVAAELRTELHSLRAERAAVFAPPEPDPDWPVEDSFVADSLGARPDWVAAAVPPPLQRPFTVPRLALEAVFLLLVALFAGLADLAPEWIALVMAGAWVLVAIVEWTAAVRRARWRLDEIPPPLEPAADTTGRWSAPVVEATALAQPDSSESRTVVAKLPAPAEAAEDVEPADTPAPEVAPEAAAEDTEETEPQEEPEEEPEETGEQPAKPPRRGFFRRRATPAAAEAAQAPDGAQAPEAAPEDTEDTKPAEDAATAGAAEPDAEREEPRRGFFRRARPAAAEAAQAPEAAPGDTQDTKSAEDATTDHAAEADDETKEPPRRGFFRRRSAEPAAPADPWET